MVELKRISDSSVPAALEKALRYRLLNEPREAESICQDILEVEPNNQSALVTMLLAQTDLFDSEFTDAHERAKAVLGRLEGDYDQAYYEGIVNERWAKAELSRKMPERFVLGWLREAMGCYERAQQLSKSDDPEAILRWNTCARMLQRFEEAEAQVASSTHDVEAEFGDDVPLR